MLVSKFISAISPYLRHRRNIHVFNTAKDNGPFFYTAVFTLVISFATILGRVLTMMPGTLRDHLAQISSLIDSLWLDGTEVEKHIYPMGFSVLVRR